MKCLIGRKTRMGQVFQEDGTVIPVTVVSVEPNIVTAIRPTVKGQVVAQIGTIETKKAISAAQKGHLKDLPSLKVLRDVKAANAEVKRGDVLDLSVFVPGTKVDVTGISKGHGFQGVVKRHHFRGSPASHGHKDQLRMPGSLGSHRQGPVIRGHRMGGRMGGDQVTIKHLEVVAVDIENKTISIKGSVPGARNGLVLIKSTDGKNVWHT